MNIFDHFYEFWKLKKETMEKSEASSIVEIEKKYRIQYQQKIINRFYTKVLSESIVRFCTEFSVNGI